MHTFHIVYEILVSIICLALLAKQAEHSTAIRELENKYIDRFKMVETRYIDKLGAFRKEITDLLEKGKNTAGTLENDVKDIKDVL